MPINPREREKRKNHLVSKTGKGYINLNKSIVKRRHEMKKIAVLIVLLTSFFLTAMSDAPKENPKSTTTPEIQVEEKTNDGTITQEELHNLAYNYYKYMFEEEHEFKGIKRKEGEELIRSVVRFKADSLTLAYMVSFNPDGHVLILSNKNYGSPYDRHGSGVWSEGVNEGELSVYDDCHHMITQRRFDDLYKNIKSNNLDQNKKFIDQWGKFLVPPEEFHERVNFDLDYHPPQWWLEKKSSKAVKILKE
jgi:hypothetical protein